MKIWSLIGSAVGVAFTLWLLSKYGFDRILALVVTAGWAIPAVAVIHVPQILASGSGWRMVTEERTLLLTWRSYYLLRWIREGINNLLPVAQLGGVAVGTRLLVRRGVQLPAAVASAIVDTTLEFISQIAFTLMGLGLLFASAIEHEIENYAIAGVLVAGALAAALLAAQWFGLAKILEWGIEKFGKSWGRTEQSGIKGLHEAIMELYHSPQRIGGGFLFHLIAWLLGAVEIYISLGALGHRIGIITCLVIEALGQALKTAGFAIPAALGVQEGGYVLAGTLFGLSPEVGIALSLIKRLRDAVLGLPALAAWHWLEGRPHAADMPSA
jgi:putative membrane protein